MELAQQFLIVYRRVSHPLAKLGHSLRNIAHSFFIVRRKKKWPQEWAMYPAAERQMCVAELSIKLFREFWRPAQLRLHQLIHCSAAAVDSGLNGEVGAAP